MLSRLFVKNKFFVPLLTIPVIMSLIGLVFIFEASSVRAVAETGNSLHYFRLQGIWFLLGMAVLFFFSRFDYKKLYFLSFLSMAVTILLLVVVLIPGIGSSANGARRWIDFGFFNVQPTELAKFSIIVYLASWFRNSEKRRFLSFISLVGFLIFLIILQPDMGTSTIVMLLSLIIYYLAGMNMIHLFLLAPVVAGAFYLLIKSSPYRFNRFMAFMNPASDPLGIGYHINQILISLSNGGVIGSGFGSSRQKYLFLPEAHTDSIFAIIGEEYGLVGGLILLSLYFVFVYKIYHLIRVAPDKLSRLLVCGVFAFFNLQVIINLAGVTGLFPLTGVPLPFLSYGGSNLLISFALVGILLNIERKVRV
ncbi:MAG: FtsW/RodA/SpoVE family cell cycle protein [Patescibacteria group bacterium]